MFWVSMESLVLITSAPPALSQLPFNRELHPGVRGVDEPSGETVQAAGTCPPAPPLDRPSNHFAPRSLIFCDFIFWSKIYQVFDNYVRNKAKAP